MDKVVTAGIAMGSGLGKLERGISHGVDSAKKFAGVGKGKAGEAADGGEGDKSALAKPKKGGDEIPPPPTLNREELEAATSVLLAGGEGTGKTTFIDTLMRGHTSDISTRVAHLMVGADLLPLKLTEVNAFDTSAGQAAFRTRARRTAFVFYFVSLTSARSLVDARQLCGAVRAVAPDARAYVVATRRDELEGGGGLLGTFRRPKRAVTAEELAELATLASGGGSAPAARVWEINAGAYDDVAEIAVAALQAVGAKLSAKARAAQRVAAAKAAADDAAERAGDALDSGMDSAMAQLRRLLCCCGFSPMSALFRLARKA